MKALEDRFMLFRLRIQRRAGGEAVFGEPVKSLRLQQKGCAQHQRKLPQVRFKRKIAFRAAFPDKLAPEVLVPAAGLLARKAFGKRRILDNGCEETKFLGRKGVLAAKEPDGIACAKFFADGRVFGLSERCGIRDLEQRAGGIPGLEISLCIEKLTGQQADEDIAETGAGRVARSSFSISLETPQGSDGQPWEDTSFESAP